MGQSSSQVAPTQATQGVAETLLEATTPGTKRSAPSPSPSIEYESGHRVKKVKIASPPKSQKKTKAKPQHKRGGTIRPSLQPDPLQHPSEETRSLQHVEIPVVRLQSPEPLRRSSSYGSRAQVEPGPDAQLQDEYSAARNASEELQRVLNAENIPPIIEDDELLLHRKPKRQKPGRAPKSGVEGEPLPERTRVRNSLIAEPDANAGAKDVGANNVTADQILVRTATSTDSPRSKQLKRVQFDKYEEETLTQGQRPRVEQSIPSVDGSGDTRSNQRKSKRHNVSDTKPSAASRGGQVERPTSASAHAPPQTDTIPTPPKSSVVKVATRKGEANPRPQGGRDQPTKGAGLRQTRMSPRNRINNWLDSDEFPPPPFQGTISPSPERKRSAHRKPVKPAQQQPPEVIENVTQEVATTAVSAEGKAMRSGERRRRTSHVPNLDHTDSDQNISTSHGAPDGGPVQQVPDENVNWLAPYDDTRPTAMRQYQSAERGTQTGAWSAEEKKLADEVWNNFLKNNANVTDWDLRTATLDWANIGLIKLEMNEAFPHRTIAAIRKYCQRRFTPYKMGPWNAEEDEALKKEYARLPDNWTEIGYNLMRPAQATRDRWRNFVADAETLQKGPWSTDEEDKLMAVVAECLALIRGAEGMAGKSQAELEESISWKTVSEKMGRTRNDKRCREKWPVIKGRMATTGTEPQTDTGAVRPVPAQPVPRSDNDTNAMSAKLRRLDMQYDKLKPGDIFDALTDITEAMKDQLDREFKDESTFWAVVSLEIRKVSKFVQCPQLRRRAYYGALEKWGSKKKKVKHAVGIARKAAELKRRMVKHAEKGKLQFERAYKVDEYPTGRGRVDGIQETGEFDPVRVLDSITVPHTTKPKAQTKARQPPHDKTIDQPTKQKKHKRRSVSEAYIVDSDVDA